MFAVANGNMPTHSKCLNMKKEQIHRHIDTHNPKHTHTHQVYILIICFCEKQRVKSLRHCDVALSYPLPILFEQLKYSKATAKTKVDDKNNFYANTHRCAPFIMQKYASFVRKIKKKQQRFIYLRAWLRNTLIFIAIMLKLMAHEN